MTNPYTSATDSASAVLRRRPLGPLVPQTGLPGVTAQPSIPPTGTTGAWTPPGSVQPPIVPPGGTQPQQTGGGTPAAQPPGPIIQPPILPPLGATGPLGATQPFGPGNNLIGTQINPSMSPDTAAARAQLGSLFSTLGTQAPNRLALAQQALKTFDENQANQEKLGVQDIGREAAAAGRLGSGMVSTSLGDLQTRLNQERLQMERGLAGDVAGQTLADRLAAIEGTQGVLGQLGGLDTQEQQALRGERGYQQALDQQAIQNAVEQFGLEQGAQAQQFGQQYDINQLLAELGFGGNTAGPLQEVATTYGNEAANLQAGAGNILRNAFGQPLTPAPAYPPVYSPTYPSDTFGYPTY